MRIGDAPSTNLSDYPFTHRIRVRFAETDAMGIVHHGRYLPYLEETRVEYLRSIDHPYTATRAEGIDFSVIEVWLSYVAPCCFDDEIDVHLRIGAVTRATFQLHYLLTVGGTMRTSAITAHSAVNSDGRPVRLPTWLSALAPSP
jgi:acyl-CoA thioester hydrolase